MRAQDVGGSSGFNPYQSSMEGNAAQDGFGVLGTVVPSKHLTDDEQDEVFRQAGMDAPKKKGDFLDRAWGAFKASMGDGRMLPQGGSSATASGPADKLTPQDVQGLWPGLASSTDTNFPQGGGQRVQAPVDQAYDHPPRGRGSSRPSSPSRTNGSQPVTAQPTSNDPMALQQADRDRLANDPAMVQLKAQLAHLGGEGGQLDLSPLMALADSWTGGHQLAGYDRPLSTKQIEGMKTQIAEQLARRQADMEWHQDRIRQMQQSSQDRVTIGAGHDAARDYATDNRPVPAPRAAGAAKLPPENDPSKVGKDYLPVIKSTLATHYAGQKEALPGAAKLVHDQLVERAQMAVQRNPGAYPTLGDAYKAAVQHWQDGSLQIDAPGLKRHSANRPDYGGSNAD